MIMTAYPKDLTKIIQNLESSETACDNDFGPQNVQQDIQNIETPDAAEPAQQECENQDIASNDVTTEPNQNTNEHESEIGKGVNAVVSF